jgi:hypothetical protein
VGQVAVVEAEDAARAVITLDTSGLFALLDP